MDDENFNKFYTSVKNYLLLQGCELEEIVKGRYMKLKHIEETIYICLFNVGFVSVFYTKDDYILDSFKGYSKKYIKALEKFKSFHRRRNYKRLFENDSELQTYF